MGRKFALASAILLIGGRLMGAPGDIFKTWWRGIYVQGFTAGPSACIKGLRAVGPDSAGFVYLQAVTTAGDSGYIFKTWWRGIQVQSFLPDPPHCLRGFNTSTSGEWVILEAYNGFASGQVLRTRLRGTFVQEFHGDCPIVGFSARSEPGGWIYLSVDTACGILGDSSSLDVKESVGGRFLVRFIPTLTPRLRLFLPEEGVVDVKVYSSGGRLVQREKRRLPAGSSDVPLKVSGEGVYMAVVRWGDERKIVRFILRKEKRR